MFRAKYFGRIGVCSRLTKVKENATIKPWKKWT